MTPNVQVGTILIEDRPLVTRILGERKPSYFSSNIPHGVTRQLFDARVGFGVMDFTQTMDSAPFTFGTHGLDIRRFSKPAEQSEELTNWVASIFKT